MRFVTTSLLTATLAFAAGITQAASISFNAADTGVPATVLNSFPFGVEPSSNWTQANSDQNNLIDDSGVATTLDLDVAGFTLSTFNTIPDNTIHRYGDSHFPGSEADTWTLNQIPYAEYIVIVYVSGNNLVQGSITDGSTTFYWDDAANKANAANLVEITDTNASGTPVFGTYAVFGSEIAPLTGSSKTISWDATGQAGASILNGFQVVQVPEPGSLALMGIGGLLIARRRRG